MIAPLPSTVDAVVVGAGPNGLVAANRLADAGWEVLLVEAQDDLGGAVRSDREVHPDFVHDTFSAFYPMAAASPVIAALDLPAYGLRWRHAPAVLGHPWPDGSWTILHRDAEVTAALLDREHPGDGDAWLALVAQWRRIGPALVGALLSPMPPVRSGLRAALTLPRVGGLEFVQRLLSPARHTLDAPVAGRAFGGRGARMLVAGNAAHADLASTSAGSSVIGLLLAMLGQTVGFPVPEGGAGRLTGAMAARLQTRGGQVVTGAPVERVLVEGGRAAGVVLGGSLVRARRAVVAGVGVHQLVQHLLDPDDVPARYLDRVRRFRMDPATVKVDFALSGPVPWRGDPAYAAGTVHLCDSLDELSAYEGQLAADLVPERPFLLIGQMTTSDPTRSPAGTESLWAYTHVPQRVRGDAGGTLTGRLGRRRRGPVRRPDAGPDRGVRARFRLAGAGPPGALPDRAGTTGRQSGRRRGRWRLVGPGPAADLPAGARTRPGRDPDPRSLPRLGVGAPGRGRARGRRGQRRPRRPVVGPAASPADSYVTGI